MKTFSKILALVVAVTSSAAIGKNQNPTDCHAGATACTASFVQGDESAAIIKLTIRGTPISTTNYRPQEMKVDTNSLNVFTTVDGKDIRVGKILEPLSENGNSVFSGQIILDNAVTASLQSTQGPIDRRCSSARGGALVTHEILTSIDTLKLERNGYPLAQYVSSRDIREVGTLVNNYCP